MLMGALVQDRHEAQEVERLDDPHADPHERVIDRETDQGKGAVNSHGDPQSYSGSVHDHKLPE